MAITEAYAGSATIGTTEYSLPNNSTTLTPIAVAGVWQLFLDLSALTATESYRIKLYETVNSNKRVFQQIDVFGVAGGPSDPLYVSPSFALLNGWDMTVTKLQGTSRSIAWSIRKAG